MIYKRGDIVLIKFPFTTLSLAKKRPVLIFKDQNEYGDFVCFQITSKSTQSKLKIIADDNLIDGKLKLESFVKYDKCFTLNSEIVEKRLASVSNVFLKKIKRLFCDEII